MISLTTLTREFTLTQENYYCLDAVDVTTNWHSSLVVFHFFLFTPPLANWPCITPQKGAHCICQPPKEDNTDTYAPSPIIPLATSATIGQQRESRMPIDVNQDFSYYTQAHVRNFRNAKHGHVMKCLQVY